MAGVVRPRRAGNGGEGRGVDHGRRAGRPGRRARRRALRPAGAGRTSATRGGSGSPTAGSARARGAHQVQPAAQAGLLDRGGGAHPEEAADQDGDEHEARCPGVAAEQRAGQRTRAPRAITMIAAGPAGGDGALFLAAGGLPDRGFHQPAAVQRQPGQHVEDADQQVRPDKDVGRMSATPDGPPAEISSQPPPASTKFAAGPAMATRTDRPGVAVKLSNWVWPPQRLSTIFSRGPAVDLGGQRVGELVDQHGDQQQQRVGEGHVVGADAQGGVSCCSTGP